MYIINTKSHDFSSAIWNKLAQFYQRPQIAQALRFYPIFFPNGSFHNLTPSHTTRDAFMN